MKPTKMRNRQIYRAGKTVRSRQLAGTLSDDLRERYGRRSVRIVEGDTVRVLRGEYKNVDGRVSKVSTDSGRIAIEGIKKEKGKGDKFDVMIHASNVMVTSLNTGDGWRISKLEGKSKKEAKKSTPKDDKEELKKDAKSEVILEETDADLDEKTDPKDDTDKADAEEVRTVEASDDKESDKPSKEDT